ncbi:hypothetical protein MAC_02134 [Metarhizium acridum CQMa 102]|uniref:Uncharacterized protein n=1 Tax=Metarhizium acridum (strain CQMa 102) TaxID=655827 RepID=E9DWY6_METAQ|nr:uncharacterized protein MAC_02134 [Metarhizium acridum CQMa 102]EFY91849.1 hypothetical protein MAC_02134 [Metarhizium acridum CQMa 102]
MPAVLEALQWPTVNFDASAASPGPNTRAKTDIVVETWEDWTDFTFENIMAMYGPMLARPYLGQREPRPLKKDLEVYDETSVDDGLRRFMMPIINSALHSMMRKEELSDAPYYCRGTRCDLYEFKPDWAAVSDLVTDKREYKNLVGGDTKVSSKFGPDMLLDNFKEWQKVLTQIAAYADHLGVRYNHILTDQGAVVLRFSRRRIAPGIAANLPKRSTRSFLQLSSDPYLPSSQPYEDEDARGSDPVVEFKSIPWSVSGSGKLTAKLALAVLPLISLYGDRYIAYSYPRLSMWRTANQQERGGRIKHNTNGAVLPAGTRGMRMEEPEPINDEHKQKDKAHGEEGREAEDEYEDEDGNEDEDEDEFEDEDEDEDKDEDDDEEARPRFSRAPSTLGDRKAGRSRTYVTKHLSTQ